MIIEISIDNLIPLIKESLDSHLFVERWGRNGELTSINGIDESLDEIKNQLILNYNKKPSKKMPDKEY